MLRGSIEYNASENKTYFYVAKNGDGVNYEYRPFDTALAVNTQEQFSIAHTELHAYVMDGPFTNFGAGVSMTADLNKFAGGLPVGQMVAKRDDGEDFWGESERERTKSSTGQGGTWSNVLDQLYRAV